FADPTLSTALDDLGVFQAPGRWVELSFAASIRRYVEMGFGIGLVGRPPSRVRHGPLHEHVMSRDFGRLPVYLVRPRAPLPPDFPPGSAEAVKIPRNRPPAKPATPRPDKSTRVPAPTDPTIRPRIGKSGDGL